MVCKHDCSVPLFLKDDLGALQALKRLCVPAEAAQCCARLDYWRYKARVWFAEALSLCKSLGLCVGAQTTRHKCLVYGTSRISVRAGKRNPGALTPILDIKSRPNFFLLHIVK